MSINPPTDLVLDVVRAANPARHREATARLTQGMTEGVSTVGRGDFAAILAKTDATPPAPTVALPARTASPASAAEAYEAFEGLALATMIDAALPESKALFGEGPGADVWKSMLAEQIGLQMARVGGIGLAEQLASSAALPDVAGGEAAGALLRAQMDRAMAETLGGSERS